MKHKNKMSPKTEDTVITMIRDEFSRMHDHLNKQDTVFAAHVLEDRETARLAAQTDQKFASMKTGIYITWTVIVAVVGLVIAYLKL